ncbi:HPr kinase/phosphorylase [Phaeovulum sp.]|uniref:HPr kinase/phosphorylase n=1 Tax=Phaeovulum sp. TaxID=2934796 RepID=UPI0039E37D99
MTGLTVHASAVALLGRGVLILGASGAGKSSLALELMALGARLVSDDQTTVTARRGVLYASAPAPIRGLIEARGIGLLRADPVAEAGLVLAIDLDHDEKDRLPPCREWHALDCALPLVLRVRGAHFSAGIIQYLKAGRAT